MALRHYHNHYRFSYPTSFKRHLSSLIFVLAFVIIVLLFIIHSISPQTSVNLNEISPSTIILAAFNTLFRLTIAYIFSLLFSIPITLVITSSEKLEKVLLPVADIIQSIPVLAFFPVIILVFLKFDFFDGAAIFILFTAMVWNIVFSMIGGIKTVPEDIQNASRVFGARGVKKLMHVTLPAIFPSIVTGSFLAWAQGWNISIVAEALHAFIPNGSTSQDLFGLGSLLVNSFSQSKNAVFFASLISMVLVITIFNFFVWQKLLHIAERFKFD